MSPTPDLVTIPRAEYERLLWAQDYVDRQRARSRRTYERKRADARPVNGISSHRPDPDPRPVNGISSHRPDPDPRPVNAISNHRADPEADSDGRPVTQSQPGRPASRARGGYLFPESKEQIESKEQSARASPAGDTEHDDALWRSAEVLAAAARRPGLELDALRLRMAVWLQDEAPTGAKLTRKLILTFIDRWRPPPVVENGVPLKHSDRATQRNGIVVDSHKYDWLETTPEDRMDRIAALKAAGA